MYPPYRLSARTNVEVILGQARDPRENHAALKVNLNAQY